MAERGSPEAAAAGRDALPAPPGARGWFRALLAALRRVIALQETKTAVEIIAIVVGGGWALWEHVIQVGQARARREGYSWASATIDTKTTATGPARFLLHATVTLKNTSRRLVEPLF